MTEKPLVIGDVFRHGGERYRVTHITDDGDRRSIAIVALESPSVGEMLTSEDGGLVLDEIVPA